jgi:hypothetical protein
VWLILVLDQVLILPQLMKDWELGYSFLEGLVLPVAELGTPELLMGELESRVVHKGVILLLE